MQMSGSDTYCHLLWRRDFLVPVLPPSHVIDQIPNNVAHSTEGKMARVCWKGKRRSKARRKRKKKSSKSLAQAGVALARPLPRTPEQESCTVPVQVRPAPKPRPLCRAPPGLMGLRNSTCALAPAPCPNSCVSPAGG